MIKYLTLLILLFIGCENANVNKEIDYKTIAEKFFRGVYGCNPSMVDSLAAEDILITYPIFENLYGTSFIRGRENVKVLVNNFCSHWTEAQFTIHETIAENDKVVILSGFCARNTGEINGKPPSNEIVSWGGISVFSFNDQGKITSEVCEESEPGPFERLTIYK